MDRRTLPSRSPCRDQRSQHVVYHCTINRVSRLIRGVVTSMKIIPPIRADPEIEVLRVLALPRLTPGRHIPLRRAARSLQCVVDLEFGGIALETDPYDQYGRTGEQGTETENQGCRRVPERGIPSPAGRIHPDGRQRGLGHRQKVFDPGEGTIRQGSDKLQKI